MVSKKIKDGKNKKCTYKGNNGSERGAGHHRDEKITIVRPRQKDGENIKINYGMDTTGEKEKRTSKKNVDGKSTSSHDNKKLRTRSMEKQRGMVFGFQKMATAVKKKRIDDRLSFLSQDINHSLQHGIHIMNSKIYCKP